MSESNTIRVPKSLMEKSPGGLGLFRAIPGFNRDNRRNLAASIKRKHWNVSPAGRPATSDDELIRDYLLDPKSRIDNYWHYYREILAKGGTKKINPTLSIDHFLLDAFCPSYWLRTLEDRGIQSTKSLLAEIGKLGEISTECETADMVVPCSTWLEIEELLPRIEGLSSHEIERLVCAIFALDGISRSRAFSDRAIARCPALSESFMSWEVYSPVGARQPKDEAGASDDKSVSDAAKIDPWVSLDAEFTRLASHRDKTLDDVKAGKIAEIVNRISSLADDFEEEDPGSVAAIKKLDELGHVIEGLRGAPHVDWLFDAWREYRSAVIQTLDELLESESIDRIVTEIDGLSVLLNDQLPSIELISSNLEEKRRIADSIVIPEGATVEALRARQSHSQAMSNLAAVQAQLLSCRIRLVERMEKGRASLLSKSTVDTQMLYDSIDEVSGASETLPTTPRALDIRGALKAPGETNSGSAIQAQTPFSASTAVPDVERTRGGIRPNAEPRRGESETEGSRVTEASVDVERVRTNNDPRFDAAAGDKCRPIWESIESGRCAVAFHVAQAISLSDPQLVVPPLDLIQAVDLAAALQTPHGGIAGELEKIYQRLHSATFNDGPDAWRLGLGLLLVAATLRPSLIAPRTGALAVSEYAHVSGQLGALYELRRLVGDVGHRLQGHSLSAASFRITGDAAGWHAALKALKSEIQEWASREIKRTIKFAAATDVWRRLVSSAGEYGQCFDVILHWDPEKSDAPGAIRTIQDRLAKFSDRTRFEERVHQIDRNILHRRTGEKIHAGAMSRLLEKSAEADDLLRRWLDLAEGRPTSGGFLETELENLHRGVKEKLPIALDELRELSDASTDYWPLGRAGAAAVMRSLENLEELLQADRRIKEPERDPRELLRWPLLLLADVDVGRDWTIAPEVEMSLDATTISALTGSAVEWERAISARLSRGDIFGADLALGYLASEESPLAERLSQSRDKAWDSARRELQREVAEARKQLEVSLAYGYITETQRANDDARLVALDNRIDDIRSFGPELAQVREIRDGLKRAKEDRLSALANLISELKLEPSSTNAQRLAQAMSSGDALTANEYLQRVKAGEQLEAAEPTRLDVFATFFPQFAKDLEAYLQTDTIKTSRIPSAIRNKESIGPLRFANLTTPQVESATEMASRWFGLKRTTESSTSVRDSVVSILESIGFTGVQLGAVKHDRGRAEFDLNVDMLADRRVCPVPQFGSEARGRYRVVCLWERPNEEDLFRLLGDTVGPRALIVLYLGRLGESHRREIARNSRRQRTRMLILDELLLLFLCAEQKSRLTTFFACALPFAYVEPFTTTSGLVPREMFYGRVDELNSIREANGRCFIYGGRQLGKTALLREAERSYHNPHEGRYARWIDLKAEGIGYDHEAGEIWSVLNRDLCAMGVVAPASRFFDVRRKGSVDELVQQLKLWLSGDPERRILLLLDEADRFLEQDSREEYRETSRLKNLMEESGRAFKVVFAGLHNVLRTTEQANHPLAHLGAPIEIGPMMKAGEWSEARRLVVEPFLAAGYSFASEDLVVRILAQTNYYPSLIQLYCAQLLAALLAPHSGMLDYKAGPRYSIGDRVVDEVYRSKDLRDAIRSRFHLTLQLDPRYEIIAYTFAFAVGNGRFSLERGEEVHDIKEEAVSWFAQWFKGTTDQAFRVVLDEMVGLGVFRLVSPAPLRYSLRNPNVLLLMGSQEEIGSVLEKERELPVEFEPAVFRPARSGGIDKPQRAPLTFLQERELLKETSGVSVVVGTDAAGLSEVVDSLAERIESPRLKSLPPCMDKASFISSMDTLLQQRVERGLSLFVVHQDTPWSWEWLDTAVAKIQRIKAADRPARIVFVADGARLADALFGKHDVGALHLLPLGRWEDRFIRHWLENLGIKDDPASRERLCVASGQWGSLLVSVANATVAAHKTEQLAETAEAMLSNAGRRAQILAALGLTKAEAIRVLSTMRDFGPVYESEIDEFAKAADTDAETFMIWLRWGEMLGLAQRTGRDTWAIDAYVGRLLP